MPQLYLIFKGILCANCVSSCCPGLKNLFSCTCPKYRTGCAQNYFSASCIQKSLIQSCHVVAVSWWTRTGVQCLDFSVFSSHVLPLFKFPPVVQKVSPRLCDRLAACPRCLPTFNPMHAGICSSAPLTMTRKKQVKNINVWGVVVQTEQCGSHTESFKLFLLLRQ